MEDLTLRQINEAMEVILPISQTIVQHSLVILGDPSHECIGDDDFDGTDIPDFSDTDLNAFLAFEESSLSMLRFMREAFIECGYTELTREVGA